MKTIHLIRGFLLVIVPCIVFSLSLIPTILIMKLLWPYWTFSWLQVLTLPFIMYVLGLVLLTSVLLISGGFIKLFHIQYKPGVYRYSLDDRNAFLWILFCVLYTPCRKLLEAILIGRLKYWYYRFPGETKWKSTAITRKGKADDFVQLELEKKKVPSAAQRTLKEYTAKYFL